MKECSAKYKTAKEFRNSRWHEVEWLPQGAMWGASSRRSDNFGGATASSGPTGENHRRLRAGATGNAVFPTTVSAERLGWRPPSPRTGRQNPSSRV